MFITVRQKGVERCLMSHVFRWLGLISVLVLTAVFRTAFSNDLGSGSQNSPHVIRAEHGTSTEIPVYTYNVVNTYPHDRNAYTQGLVFEDGVFFEGTGLRQHSSLRRVAMKTGEILQLRELPPHLFGEGVTVYGERIIQLTWQSNVGFVYDKSTFELLREFNYPTEGWGITFDGEHLIMSDGTPNLYLLHPETFETVNRVKVHDNRGTVNNLNELEYINGEVYANVFETNRIARINAKTGRVVGWINLSGLLSAEDRIQRVGVLNGIASDDEHQRLFVTGKLWPKLFEIELIRSE